MFSAKVSSASVTRPRCSRRASARSSARSSCPATRRVPLRKRLPPRTVISSPSPTFSNRSAPGASISRTPPRTRRSGPGFGYRPVCESETFTTTRTPDSSSSSAETRSRSVWSMIAMSSAESRRTRCFVRRSRRACPLYSTKLIERSRELSTAEHTLELVLPLRFGQLLDSRVGGVARHLLDAKVPVGDACDLRQVRDREHLRVLAQPAQRLRHGMRRLAADPRVDLVEHQCHLPSRCCCEGERDAAELAA